MNIRKHVYFSGKVQGVFFRSNTQQKAQELGVSGWVRNLQDGRVEAVFEGDEEKIEKIMQWCRKGPEYAAVKDMEVTDEQYKGEFNGFSIRY